MSTQAAPHVAANVVPDRLDLRDRLYAPPVDEAPGQKVLLGDEDAPEVLDQGRTNACTGFALATVIRRIQKRSKDYDDRPVSPYMLYDMARRYDEFPGEADVGSSLRGVLKGWYKHGVCRRDLWSEMPRPSALETKEDWWYEAARRPMGAYYRVDKTSIPDLHVAVARAGAVLASAYFHPGWREGFDQPPSDAVWCLPKRDRDPYAGHAFAILGYTDRGFLIQSSYGEGWGTRGLAILSYEDWMENAMDAWVVQLGVVTAERQAVAGSHTVRVQPRSEGAEASVALASEPRLAATELADFVVDMENNGELSRRGEYRTSPDDVERLVTRHLVEACETWNGTAGGTVDVVLYAHGGLTGESAAARTAGPWLCDLYSEALFPVFLMWETDVVSTLANRLRDVVGDLAAAGSFLDRSLEMLDDFLGERRRRLVEETVRWPGTALWDEMKQNAEQLTRNPASGVRQLVALLERHPPKGSRLRLHLVGHSAGAVVHCHLAPYLAARGIPVASVTLLAAAARVDLFERTVLPCLRRGEIDRVTLVNLSRGLEESDDSVRPLLGYDRSLLCLVANAFEGRNGAPLLGLQQDADKALGRWKLPESKLRQVTAMSTFSHSRQHGDFSRDDTTRKSVIEEILGTSPRAAAVPEEPGDGQLVGAIRVAGGAEWKATGIRLLPGRYRFLVDGSPVTGDVPPPLAAALQGQLPVQRIGDEPVPFGGLVARVGSPQAGCFAIRSGTEREIGQEGELFCWVNSPSGAAWGRLAEPELSVYRLS